MNFAQRSSLNLVKPSQMAACASACVDGPDGAAVIAILNCVVKSWN